MSEGHFTKPQNYSYQNKPSVNYRRFNHEYFSGADVRIYFGDVWVDEITSIYFTLQEQVAPIFGYASFTWDRVARGARQIEGSFTINFKESYYLHAVMKSVLSKMTGTDPDTASSGFDASQFTKNLNIEHLLSENSKNFEGMATQFEESMWGRAANEEILSDQAARKSGPYFYNYGPSADDEGGDKAKRLMENGFNIAITYGNNVQVEGGSANSGAAHSLIGVQLTGVSMIMGPDGRPLSEQYSFIAKDLSGDVTKF